MGRVIKWLAGLLVAFLLLLVVADRGTKYFVEREAAKTLGGFSQFETAPTVNINGVPFLTQALGGVYDDVVVSSPKVTIQSGTNVVHDASLNAHLEGIHLSLAQLRSGSIQQLPVDQVDGTVVVPYAEVARLSAIDGLTLSGSGGKVQVKAPLTVPIIGKVTVVATGTLAMVDGGIKLNVTSASVDGTALPTSIVNSAAGAFSSVIPIPTLPYGLKLTGVSATSGGVALTGSGTDVVLARIVKQ